MALTSGSKYSIAHVVEDKEKPFWVCDTRGIMVDRFASKQAAVASVFAAGGRIDLPGNPPKSNVRVSHRGTRTGRPVGRPRKQTDESL